MKRKQKLVKVFNEKTKRCKTCHKIVPKSHSAKRCKIIQDLEV